MKNREAASDAFRSRIYGNYVGSRGADSDHASAMRFSKRAPYLRDLVRKYFPKDRNARILDLGCGDGSLIRIARQLGYEQIHGVDRSREQVEAARLLGVSDIDDGDFRETLESCGDESLDVVVSFDVIEHFTRDELLPIVDNVLRVLTPSGRWLIHVPNAESPFGVRVLYSDLTHEQAFTRISLNQLLLSSGFQEVKCYEDAPIVRNLKSALRWVLWKVLRSAVQFYLAVETGDYRSNPICSQNLLAVATKKSRAQSYRDVDT